MLSGFAWSEIQGFLWKSDVAWIYLYWSIWESEVCVNDGFMLIN